MNPDTLSYGNITGFRTVVYVCLYIFIKKIIISGFVINFFDIYFYFFLHTFIINEYVFYYFI